MRGRFSLVRTLAGRRFPSGGLVVFAMLAGCADSTDGGDASPSTRDGAWSGPELAFEVSAGRVVSIQVGAASCTGDEGCSVDFPARTLGSVEGVVAFSAKDDVARVEGQFFGAEQASGSLVLNDGSDCCTVVTAWTASWQAPIGGVDAGGGGDGGGGLGSPNWGGHSTGTVHPGPARLAPLPDRTGIEGVDPDQRAAAALLDQIRAQVGVAAARLDAAAAAAAQAHAGFYVAHATAYSAAGLSPHAEDASFGDGFTGKNFGDRMKAAGYAGSPSSEVMAFTGGASGAITGWMETLYHRLPLIAPDTVDFGYGQAAAGKAKCEVMVFGAGKVETDPIVVWPTPGATDVPRSWDGAESPQPAPPPSGYPSGPMVTARLPKGAVVEAHALQAVGDTTPIAHVFLDAGTDSDLAAFDARSVALYADAPLAADTSYEVSLVYRQGTQTETLRWRFSTRP